MKAYPYSSSSSSLYVLGAVVFTVVVIVLFSSLGKSNGSLAVTKESELPGVVETFQSHLGPVSVRILGDRNNVPVLCLPGINPALVNEWVPVAQLVSQKGYAVYIINFHSNPKSTPSMMYGGVTTSDVSIIISDIISKYLKANDVLLMGKSWGGGQALQFAASHPGMVKKLCLIAPASSDSSHIKSLRKHNIPVLLAWAKDDFMISFSNTKSWQKILGDNLKFVSATTGGHKILLEYGEEIIRFIEE